MAASRFIDHMFSYCFLNTSFKRNIPSYKLNLTFTRNRSALQIIPSNRFLVMFLLLQLCCLLEA